MSVTTAIQYPLSLNFKLLALAPRISVRDANGQLLLYVQQKVLALKEHVKVFADEKQTQQLYEIKANKRIDFSARYNFTDMNGTDLGGIQHKGMRSIFKATYEIYAPGAATHSHHLKEDNGWVKVFDAIAGEIPIISMFTGYFFNPSYTLYEVGTEKPVLALKKEPSFFESGFTITKLDPNLGGVEELRLLLALLMTVQMERSRG
jgi:uncharacterized protein YxjI